MPTRCPSGRGRVPATNPKSRVRPATFCAADQRRPPAERPARGLHIPPTLDRGVSSRSRSVLAEVSQGDEPSRLGIDTLHQFLDLAPQRLTLFAFGRRERLDPFRISQL